MKILSVVGSTRDGNSKFMVSETIKAMQSNSSIQIEEVNLKDITINFCNGCLSCDSTGECVFNDDMSAIVSKAREADGFIFATPARWGLLSGEMKTFLDRLNPLAVKEELKDKRAIIFAVGQSEVNDSKSISLAADSLKTFCDNSGIKIVETVIVCGCYGKDDVEKDINSINACKAAGIKLINNLQ